MTTSHLEYSFKNSCQNSTKQYDFYRLCGGARSRHKPWPSRSVIDIGGHTRARSVTGV